MVKILVCQEILGGKQFLKEDLISILRKPQGPWDSNFHKKDYKTSVPITQLLSVCL